MIQYVIQNSFSQPPAGHVNVSPCETKYDVEYNLKYVNNYETKYGAQYGKKFDTKHGT